MAISGDYEFAIKRTLFLYLFYI